MWRSLAVLACAACSSSVGDPPEHATKPDARIASTIDGGPKWTDAEVMVDAAPNLITLSQTTNNTIVQNASAGCASSNGYTEENTWYRIFDLPAYNIPGAFRLKNITFGVDDAAAQTVNVRIGTYGGTVGSQLDTGNSDFSGQVTQLGAATASVPATTNGVMVPVETDVMIPANSKLIVAIHAPSRAGVGGTFFIGATNTGQSHPGYIRAPVCGVGQPVTLAAINFPNTHILLTVTGEKLP